MPMMNSGANGATPRQGNEEEEPDYDGRLNTYIYDYFVKTHRFECAKAMLNSDMPLKTVPKRRDGEINGVSNMHVDSKDDLESKIPDDLPLAGLPTDPQGASFLLEWFGLFWDVFFAHQRKAPPASAQAMQYVARTQVGVIAYALVLLLNRLTAGIPHAPGTEQQHAPSSRHDAWRHEWDERLPTDDLPSTKRNAG